MDEADPFTHTIRPPTATRPLIGLTVLVVEDSRYACEAMRLLCLRSGARIRRADSLSAARRHLTVYRPSVLIVDLGLPDGSGLELIEDLAQNTPRVGVILGMSGDAFAEDAALAAGADGFIAKPIHSLATFQEAILTRLPAQQRPIGPRALSDETITPDPIAYQDDIALVAELLGREGDENTLDYIAQFLRGVALSADDGVLASAAEELADKRASGRATESTTARLAGLVQERLHQRAAI